ncbi:class I SAM-dependent methyltransferase [Pseudotenacibaculum haliotis]|uniref:Class I SAM-dependent methyltransferase n=1 Tax=Pseudotenacibaculum haliotis TaxID=1862138 RepID=A0ABW5LSK0_9FLAO
MSDTCILCKSNDLKTVQKIKASDINDLYVRDLNVDVLSEFKGNEYIEYQKCSNCKLHFFSPILTGSPKFYESLLKPEEFYYKDDRYEFFLAKKHIKKTDKVLEIGSGSGHFSQIINVDDYTGLEYNDKAIADAKEKGIQLIKKSIEDYALEHENEFDVVCSFQVLEHVVSPHDYIQSSLKVLKKGGLIIFGVPSADSILTDNINHTLNFPPHHITRWYNETFKNFEKIFDVEVVSVNNEPVSDRLKKSYTLNLLTNNVYKLFSKKGIIISNTSRFRFVKKLVKKFINITGKRSNTQNKKGEAVIVVLRKR